MKLQHDEMQQQLHSALQAAACSDCMAQAAEVKAHDMHKQLQTCQQDNHQLQHQLAELQEHSRESEAELLAKLTTLQEQHAVVARELSLLQRIKQVTAEKLETARKKLGLSEVEGRQFLQVCLACRSAISPAMLLLRNIMPLITYQDIKDQLSRCCCTLSNMLLNTGKPGSTAHE
jgi:predicted  nucleic acid-binding Zn-ribbon protein